MTTGVLPRSVTRRSWLTAGELTFVAPQLATPWSNRAKPLCDVTWSTRLPMANAAANTTRSTVVRTKPVAVERSMRARRNRTSFGRFCKRRRSQLISASGSIGSTGARDDSDTT